MIASLNQFQKGGNEMNIQRRWCVECGCVTKHVRPSVLDGHYCIRCFVLEDNYNRCVICSNKSKETERAKFMHSIKEPFVCDHCISTLTKEMQGDEMQKNIDSVRWALEQAKEVLEKEGKLPKNEKIIVDTSKCQPRIVDTGKTYPRFEPEDLIEALGAEVVGKAPQTNNPMVKIVPKISEDSPESTLLNIHLGAEIERYEKKKRKKKVASEKCCVCGKKLPKDHYVSSDGAKSCWPCAHPSM